MVWVLPVGSNVTSSLGGAGAVAATASSCAASKTWAVFWPGVSTITWRFVRSVMVDTLCPITSTSVRDFVPLTRMTMRGIAPLIIAAIAPSMVTSVVTVTSARTAAEHRATSAQIARQGLTAAAIPTGSLRAHSHCAPGYRIVPPFTASTCSGVSVNVPISVPLVPFVSLRSNITGPRIPRGPR